MEKTIYLLTPKIGESPEELKASILKKIEALKNAGASQLKACFSDNDVSPASPLRIINSDNPPSALISFWLDSAIESNKVESILAPLAGHLSGYLVTESEPLPNKQHPATQGTRTFGMNQVVLLQQPERLGRDEWLNIWLHSHTDIAINIQSTFGYRQNLVVRPLTENAPAIDAIVEENFPPEAMTDRKAFFNAQNDEGLCHKREQNMIESCSRFIDFDKIDCIPMSEYRFD